MESLILALTMTCALGVSSTAVAANAPKKTETRAEYIKKAHAELDELGRKIDDLERRSRKAGASAEEGLEKKLAALKVRRQAANKDFVTLKRASGKAWIGLKAGVDKGIDELKTAYDEAAKE